MSAVENISEATAPAINVTDSAANKVYELIQEEENPELKLRVFVTGGGCSGFQYGFSFDEKANEDDVVVVKKFTVADATSAEIKLLVDSLSISYLTGAEIDYRKDIHGEQFIIRNNPNAKTTCGCGSSFAAE
jgi:iron-sulfur cluster insertion protein